MTLLLSPTHANNRALINGLLGLTDIAAVGLAGVLAVWLVNNGLALPIHIITAVALGAILLVGVNQGLGNYSVDRLRRFRDQALRLAAAWALVMLVLAALGYLTGTSELFARPWSITWLFLGYLGMLPARRLAANLVPSRHDSPRQARRIVVIGAGEKGAKLIWYLRSLPAEEVTVVGIYDDRAARAPQDIAGVPVLGNIETLLEAARRDPPDMIIIALPGEATDRLETVLRTLEGLPAEITFCPDSIGAALPKMGLQYIGELCLLTIIERRARG